MVGKQSYLALLHRIYLLVNIYSLKVYSYTYIWDIVNCVQYLKQMWSTLEIRRKFPNPSKVVNLKLQTIHRRCAWQINWQAGAEVALSSQPPTGARTIISFSISVGGWVGHSLRWGWGKPARTWKQHKHIGRQTDRWVRNLSLHKISGVGVGRPRPFPSPPLPSFQCYHPLPGISGALWQSKTPLRERNKVRELRTSSFGVVVVHPRPTWRGW